MDTYTSTDPSELRKSPKGFITAALVIGLLLIAGFGIFQISRGFAKIDVASSNGGSVMTVPTDQSNVDPNQPIFVNSAMPNTGVKSGDLILVNETHGFTDSTDMGELVSVYDVKADSYYVSSIDVQLRKQMVTAMDSMMNAFQQDTGLKNIQIISGYRTQEYQQSLYDKDLQKTGLDHSETVAKPGFSEHQTGLAVDFNVFQSSYSEDFTGEGNYAWINEHCAEYGFILRYPQNKTEQTKIAYEPWHYRYVGVPHALYMKEHDMCLEEYIALLSTYPYTGTHLNITDKDGNAYEVYSVAMTPDSDATQVPVPGELPYTISGNNVDGFVVAVSLGKVGTPQTTTPDSATTPDSTPAVTTAAQ